MEKSLTVREDVASAIAAGQPVVALESTVIAHGLPRPLNLQTARAMQAAVREAGATPATVGVLNGQLVVGLSPEQIAFLSEAESVAKLSRADLAAVLASGLLPESDPAQGILSYRSVPADLAAQLMRLVVT